MDNIRFIFKGLASTKSIARCFGRNMNGLRIRLLPVKVWITAMAFMAALCISLIQGAAGVAFEIQNDCHFTVWVASSLGTGKQLERGQSWTVGISSRSTTGRFWGRTGCYFNGSGNGHCNTGDCGGLLNCQESGTSPRTMFEYTFNQLDLYGISLIDGFNLPMSIIPSNSSCDAIACSSNITANCPTELRVSDGCQSACNTFRTPQYCCTGNYQNNCSSSNYSDIFRGQCPQTYIDATDDTNSIFNCSANTDYKVVFCGGNATSLQESRNLTVPSENSPIPPTSTNLTSLSSNSTQPSRKTSTEIVPILLGSVVGITLVATPCLVFRRHIRRWKSCVRTDKNIAAREDFGQFIFDYKVLRDSTGNFDRNNMLGKGGFGEVYKGRLPDGRDVAVKKLNGKHTTQAVEEFLTEVKLISSVRHRNLVLLLGCCKRGHKRLLVYEFMSNNSLEKHLFGQIRNALSWENRLNIIVGTAQGLAYLHGESNVRIIHRDIKCANILLDGRFHPKIADFGLARFFPESQTHISTRVGGTLGYTAPEYAVHGQLTEKADVYSYGIVVLEIVSGRKCLDARLPTPLQLLLEWAWNQFEQDQVLDIVDSSLDGQYPTEQVLRVIKVALLCTQGSWALRPAMSTVMSMLTNNSECIVQPTRPAFIEAAADRSANSAASAATPTQESHGSASVSLAPR